MFIVVGGGLAGLLTAEKLREHGRTIVFDRRRKPGKECTGIISRSTLAKLNVGKEYVEAEFKEIELKYGKYSILVKTDVVRLDRQRLEMDLDMNFRVIRPVNAVIKEDCVVASNEVYRGRIVRAWGWKGKARWIRGIEYSAEPTNLDHILVYFDRRNVGGFSWIVPTPSRTLVGAISYTDPIYFLPHLEKRRLEVHGGAIPRAKPRFNLNAEIGDATGLIKTFTGGGIYGIAALLEPLVKWIALGDPSQYFQTRKSLIKEVTTQYNITRFMEWTWPTLLSAFRLMKDREFKVGDEFDLHSRLFRLLVPF
ncbi:hypothetical protein HS1genome_2382 [Sulfodiicoccus acidiphilus]|uniref:FAD-binding domain-containing protein n=1 Tax=Sulfodiicoccus acidiphilus TaxID=1670455 RepID=A0A348B741_9CREN|nr:NAD(P)-binding protein [Sulfodiicoccus acidiphilus]BBD73993.1 hypothetical protein HS1genome_2382 [Sulfodiicoccus acidiphilus]GGT87304.1 hypothetical protein GCM10007116_01710 [Sulfodiicoccus acidiphilus]